MKTHIHISIQRVLSWSLLAGLLVLMCVSLGAAKPASARSGEAEGTPAPGGGIFETIATSLEDGTPIEGDVINGPSHPPAGMERAAVSVSELAASASFLDVPAYEWSFGCSATSGAMIAAYFDRNGYPNFYTGPTNGGVAPANTTVWPWWTDGYGDAYAQNPLAASRNGLDGRSTRGSIDDYWVQYNSLTNDPYITNGWTQHTWGSAIGDYMKTSQSSYSNRDGATTFYNYTSIPDALTCANITGSGISKDGTVGRKLFYEARGYTVSDCYNQKTDNNGGGFTFAMYKSEIDNGQPVMINLQGHTVVGVGYENATNTVYLHDTWDTSTYSMSWGGSYQSMGMLSVSIVHLASPTPAVPSGVSATDGAYTNQVRVTWNTSVGATNYQVWRNTSNSTSGATNLGGSTGTTYLDENATPGAQFWYFVKACNTTACSNFSASDSGYRALTPPGGVNASDGTFTNKVQVGWNAATGATSYQVYRNTTNSSSGSAMVGASASAPFEDLTATPGASLWYFVKACSSTGCSAFSDGDSGYRALAIPSGVNASDGTYPYKVRVAWGASTGATQYQVFRNDSATIEGSVLVGSPAASPFDDSTAVAGTQYWYFVEACTTTGCSSASLPDIGQRLGAPTWIDASDAAFDDQVRILWDASIGASYYEVYWNTTDSSSGAALLDSPIASPYADTTGDADTIYWYFVKACNTNGCSGFSASDSGLWATALAVPDAPTFADASDRTYPNLVQISWDATYGAAYYHVYRNTSDSTSGAVLLSSPLIPSYDDSSAGKGTTYWYFLKACNASGCSDFSSSDSGSWYAWMMYLPVAIR
jgi:hypothetical protein